MDDYEIKPIPTVCDINKENLGARREGPRLKSVISLKRRSPSTVVLTLCLGIIELPSGVGETVILSNSGKRDFIGYPTNLHRTTLGYVSSDKILSCPLFVGCHYFTLVSDIKTS